jgi:LacI family transcriptional regulator
MVQRTVSMRDVARLAGVSVGTVSNTLNRPDRVGPDTQRRVRAAIAELGWVPNETARQLRGGKSRSIGLVVMDISNPFFTDLTAGVEEVAAAAGLTALVSNSAQRPARERQHLEALLHQRVRGVVLAPIGADWDEALLQAGIPLVIVDRATTTGSTCTVSVDDISGGRAVGVHLIDQGHRRVAFVGGPDVQQVHERREGVERGLLLGDRHSILSVIPTEGLTVADGRTAAQSIVATQATQRPTAVFCANDLVAIGLLQGLISRGLRVPEDVAVVGYDDIEFASAAVVPLTSVRQPRAELGRTAARLLLSEIAAADEETSHIHQQVRFTPELIVRDSSALRRVNSKQRSKPIPAAG